MASTALTAGRPAPETVRNVAFALRMSEAHAIRPFSMTETCMRAAAMAGPSDACVAGGTGEEVEPLADREVAGPAARARRRPRGRRAPRRPPPRGSGPPRAPSPRAGRGARRAPRPWLRLRAERSARVLRRRRSRARAARPARRPGAAAPARRREAPRAAAAPRGRPAGRGHPAQGRGRPARGRRRAGGLLGHTGRGGHGAAARGRLAEPGGSGAEPPALKARSRRLARASEPRAP